MFDLLNDVALWLQILYVWLYMLVCSDIDYCESHECTSDGVCVDRRTDYQCNCFNETFGTFCQHRTYTHIYYCCHRNYNIDGLRMICIRIFCWLWRLLAASLHSGGFHVSFPSNMDPLPSNRQHLSYDVCLEVRGEIIRTVLCCIVYWSCAQS